MEAIRNKDQKKKKPCLSLRIGVKKYDYTYGRKIKSDISAISSDLLDFL